MRFLLYTHVSDDTLLTLRRVQNATKVGYQLGVRRVAKGAAAGNEIVRMSGRNRPRVRRIWAATRLRRCLRPRPNDSRSE